MLMLVAVFLVVLFFAIIPEILPGLSRKMVDLVVQETNQESDLRSQIQSLKADLKTINMVDEFARYAKTERKLNRLKDEYTKISKTKSEVLLKMKFGANVVFHVVQTLFLIILIWSYRHEPVVSVPSNWLYPVQYLVAFPTGQPGAVGLTAWLLVCRSVVRKGMALAGR